MDRLLKEWFSAMSSPAKTKSLDYVNFLKHTPMAIGHEYPTNLQFFIWKANRTILCFGPVSIEGSRIAIFGISYSVVPQVSKLSSEI